jgi:hypothetical protein
MCLRASATGSECERLDTVGSGIRSGTLKRISRVRARLIGVVPISFNEERTVSFDFSLAEMAAFISLDVRGLIRCQAVAESAGVMPRLRGLPRSG